MSFRGNSAAKPCKTARKSAIITLSFQITEMRGIPCRPEVTVPVRIRRAPGLRHRVRARPLQAPGPQAPIGRPVRIHPVPGRHLQDTRAAAPPIPGVRVHTPKPAKAASRFLRLEPLQRGDSPARFRRPRLKDARESISRSAL